MSIERFEIDSTRSRIQFAVRHLVFSKARGRFGRWRGTVMIPDGDSRRATVDVVIEASSIDTGVARRDAHLRSADYLDVKRYPVITFTSRRMKVEPTGRFQLVGALTIKGVTHEVTLDVEPRDFGFARFSATAAIDRRDFGFTGNPALDSGWVVIGERVEIEVEAVKQPAARVA